MTETPERLDRIEVNLEVLSERVGQLAQEVSDLRGSVSELRESVDAINQARVQDIQLMVNITNTITGSIRELRETQFQMMQQQQRMFEQAEADRQSFQAESRRIWEYLLSQHSNGRGGEG